MAQHEDLLRRFKPALRYDSQETYFADSAAEWTDNPGNALCRKDGAVVTRGPALALDLLGAKAYANGQPVEDGDYIGNPGLRYREQYSRLRSSDRARYANRVYGRAVQGGDGRLWLQYWFWYFYNDYTLAFDVGLHEGDWEMVQLRMDGDRPDLAVYAQHSFAEVAEWEDVRHPEGSPDAPLVFSSRGSHASYFEPGLHDTEIWYDLADGDRPAPDLRLELLDDLPWARWPGRWGDTPQRFSWESASPTAPCSHHQWRDPAWLLQHEARDHKKLDPGPPPEVQVSRHEGRLRLQYDLTHHAGEPPYAVIVTVNSRDEKLVAPRAYTFEVQDLNGRLDTKIPLDARKHYDVHVSTTDAAHVPSASHATAIEPAGDQGFDLGAIPRTIGRVVAAVRRVLGGG